MANFPSAQQILDAFRAEGLTVMEMPGWRGRCRCCTGPHSNTGPHVRAWTTWHGVTMHHTAGPMLSGQRAIDYARNILIGGNGQTPGPLCLAGIDAEGRILMVGAGRANHIGSISQRSLDMMRAASFPLTGSINARGHGVDGNQHTLGFEILAPGTPNRAQRDAAVRAAAALCRLAGWDGGEVHGHGEASDSRDFSDPGWDMGAFRRDVRARLASKTNTPAPKPAPAPNPTQEDDMPISDADAQKLAIALLNTPLGREKTTNAKGEVVPLTVGAALQAVHNATKAGSGISPLTRIARKLGVDK